MKTLKSVSLKNFKGLAQVNIEITTPNYYIVGPNGSGKTTILQAIWLALQGKYGYESKKKDRFQFIQPGPGKKAASTTVKLYDSEIDQNVLVERRFTAKSEVVNITTDDGQNLDIGYLSGLLDHFTYDIQQFAAMSPVDQARLFGIDTADIDELLKSAKKTLSDFNKKKLEMQAAQRQRSNALLEEGKKVIPELEDAMEEIVRVDASELNEKITGIHAHNHTQIARATAVKTSQAEISRLETELTAEKKRLNELPVPEELIDHSEIEHEIAKAEAINRIIDKQEEEKKFSMSVDAAIKSWSDAKKEVEDLDEQRVARIQEGKSTIEEAGIPSDNIDFDEKGGLLVDGRYLNEDCYSTGELIKKAVIIINAFKKPEFPLFLIRNGSLLNRTEDGEIEIFKDLEQLGAQFICEIVGNDPVKNGILLTQDLKQ